MEKHNFLHNLTKYENHVTSGPLDSINNGMGEVEHTLMVTGTCILSLLLAHFHNLRLSPYQHWNEDITNCTINKR